MWHGKDESMDFSLYTFLAMAPITFFYVYFGVELGENWAEVKGLLQQYLVPFGIGLVMVFFIYLLVKRRKSSV